MNMIRHRFTSHFFRGLRPISFLIGSAIFSVCSVQAQTLPLTSNLVDFASAEGISLLRESQSLQDYLPLSAQFETQENLAYCGVASMVMVLNALKVHAPEMSEMPEMPGLSRYRMFTQGNLWDNPRTRAVMSPHDVARGGMTLAQLGALLNSYQVQAEVVHAQKTSLDKFRRQVAQNLQEPNNFVLVNYLRKKIGQERGGHISPIAAYHVESDRFLILDVARYKYPPVWVETKTLWRAIRALDAASMKSRGYVLVNLPSS